MGRAMVDGNERAAAQCKMFVRVRSVVVVLEQQQQQQRQRQK